MGKWLFGIAGIRGGFYAAASRDASLRLGDTQTGLDNHFPPYLSGHRAFHTQPDMGLRREKFMLLSLLLILLVLLIGVRPWAQKRREKLLAERLKQTRSPIEASLWVDQAMSQTRREGDLLAKLRDSYNYWLR